VTHLAPRQREIAMVFQNYALYPHLTVAGNIGYPLRVAGRPKTEQATRVAEAARIVSLEDYLDRKPSQLSGGQRQRVAMARAIIRQPKIFLFDEPLSNLDAKLRVQMRAEIRQLHHRIGVTSIFVTHDQVEAMTLADRIVVMNTGVIEQIGAPTEVYRRPATRFVAAFVGATPMSFLNGIVADDGERAELADGGAVQFSAPLETDRRGQPIVVGLRAEGVAVAPAGIPGAPAASYRFTEELGSHAIHHCMVGDVEVLAQGPSGAPPHEKVLSLAVDPAGVHLFDAVSGRRVEPRYQTAA
jgi:sn-glycerol 3-phosphate transport system ATP-binding protein